MLAFNVFEVVSYKLCNLRFEFVYSRNELQVDLSLCERLLGHVEWDLLFSQIKKYKIFLKRFSYSFVLVTHRSHGHFHSVIRKASNESIFQCGHLWSPKFLWKSPNLSSCTDWRFVIFYMIAVSTYYRYKSFKTHPGTFGE